MYNVYLCIIEQYNSYKEFHGIAEILLSTALNIEQYNSYRECHGIAEILLNTALNINQSII
jgi:hypothetical protein